MGIAFIGRWLGRPGKPALNSAQDEETADPGDAESQFSLGRRCAAGETGNQDFGRAAVWYLKAAEQGHCVAQFSLGLMYGQGQGVLRNELTAAIWLRKAAELGHAGAQYHLGVRLHHASKRGLKSDAAERRIDAFKWLQLAVSKGYRGAESAREFVALNLSREEVDEGGRRAIAFTAAQGAPPPLT
jgi:TPR repeat protein